jgi:hypothetical protein
MRLALPVAALFVFPSFVAGQTPSPLRIMPPDGSTFAAGQRFDIRVEAAPGQNGAPAAPIRVTLDGKELVAAGESRPGDRPGAAHFVRRGLSFAGAGEHVLAAESGGARAEVRFSVVA